MRVLNSASLFLLTFWLKAEEVDAHISRAAKTMCLMVDLLFAVDVTMGF